MLHRRACMLLPLCLALGAGVRAQTPLDIVRWTVVAQQQASASLWRIDFRADIAPGTEEDGEWRMYALDSPPPTRALSITFDALPPGMAKVGEARQSGPLAGYDEWFDAEVSYFEREAHAWVTLRGAGAVEVAGRIEFMICNSRICLPPTKVPFSVTLGAAPPEAETPPAAAEDFGADRRLWAFLLLAVGAGMGAFLMPCVYPMIPLTVSYFTKHADNLAGSVRMSLVYGLAIVSTFTALGTATAALVKGAGAQAVAANPWINLGIGAIFVVFALSLLGLFELRLPSGVVNWVNRRGVDRRGYVGVFFMGFTLTLVSFSCTVPFVGLLLPAIARGAWFYPILGMLVFSLTFSLPFMAFALFPRALSGMPGAGSWMHALQVTFGFIELAAAIKFLSNADLVWGFGLISRTIAIALCIVLFTLAGFHLVGKLRLQGHMQPEAVGIGRLMGSVVFFGLALYLLPGLLGAPLNRLDAYLPPRQSDDVSLVGLFGGSDSRAAQDEAWITDDIDAAFAEAASVSRPVMIDFTGYTCTNCREMEANVFTRSEIAERFERDFVLLRLYTDGPLDTQLQQYQLDLTGTVALPTYAIVHPRKPSAPLVQISGVVAADRFAAFLDRGVATFRL